MAMNSGPQGVTARYFGTAGGSTSRTYWIQAILPGGVLSQLVQSPTVANTLATLNSSSKVMITWAPVPGAIGYKIYGNTTGTLPTTGTILLAQVDAQTAWNDDGTPLLTDTVKYNGLSTWRMRYDFAVDGGAQSTLTPADSDTIPIGAIIFGGFVSVSATGAITSGGAATVAVGTSAGSSTTSVLAATAKASLGNSVVVIGVPGTTPFKMSAAGKLNVTIGAAALTAGSLEVQVFGMLPSAA